MMPPRLAKTGVNEAMTNKDSKHIAINIDIAAPYAPERTNSERLYSPN